MDVPSRATPRRTPSRPRRPRGTHPRRALLAAVSCLAVVAGPVAAAPAQALSPCLVAAPEAATWSTGPQRGGFVLTLVLRNVCDAPVSDWRLALRLAPGHTAQHGWNAQWTLSGDPVTATRPVWQPPLAPGGSIRIGLIGGWTGAYADPVSCTVDDLPCDGGVPNLPPSVVMTSPQPGDVAIFPGSVTLAADAVDPDGAVDRVEFYLDGELAGTDQAAPYQVVVPLGIPFCGCEAYARAFDDGDPARSADSEVVPFSLVSVPPAPYRVEPEALEIEEGGTARFLVSLSAPTTVEFEIELLGDPVLTATPAAFELDQDNGGAGQVVTVTAAPDSAPAQAGVLVSTFPNGTIVEVTVVEAGG